MTKLVGIDLGTTYSALAVLNEIGKPEIVPNIDGDRITPSVVFFDGDTPIVGTEAKRTMEVEPEKVVAGIKRNIGDENYKFKSETKEWSAAEISAEILKKLKEDCSQTTGEIKRVVITVPAYFDEVRRKETMEAGRIAGLDVVGIINEPTAAALYYATTHEVSGKVMVYDLGGGTFDVTIMNVSGTDVEIICSHGDHRLGGIDFDNVIVDLLNNGYKEKFGVHLLDDGSKKQEIQPLAEEMKKILSKREKQRISLSGDSGKTIVEVTRKEFEEKVSPLIARTEMLVESALDEAELSPGDISKVLLVGGSTRLPIIQKRLEKIMGFAPTIEINVDEAVALGASIYAGLQTIKDSRFGTSVPSGVQAGLKDVKMIDVCNHSYGTIIIDSDKITRRDELKNKILIEKNTKLPCSTKDTYYTLYDGQDRLKITVTQGEGDDPEFVKIIHEEEMKLPSSRLAGRPIDVRYSYDENQRMHCIFEDVESGQKAEIMLGMEGKQTKVEEEEKPEEKSGASIFQVD